MFMTVERMNDESIIHGELIEGDYPLNNNGKYKSIVIDDILYLACDNSYVAIKTDSLETIIYNSLSHDYNCGVYVYTLRKFGDQWHLIYTSF